MAFENPLDPVWDNYLIAYDCFAVAQRSIARNRIELWKESGHTQKTPPLDTEIKCSREELERLMMVALWATFERTIIEYVQQAATVDSNAHPSDMIRALQRKLLVEIERWRIDDLLDLLGTFIDRKLLGQVRHVKSYRDWIAHQNPAGSPSGQVRLDYAFRTLSNVLQDIHNAM